MRVNVYPNLVAQLEEALSLVINCENKYQVVKTQNEDLRTDNESLTYKLNDSTEKLQSRKRKGVTTIIVSAAAGLCVGYYIGTK
jgi:hypothetical protein